MHAAGNGRMDTVQLLMDLGADVDEGDIIGGTGAWEKGEGGAGRGHKQLTLRRGSTHVGC